MEGTKSVTLPEWILDKARKHSISEMYGVPVADVASVDKLPYSDYAYAEIHMRAKNMYQRRIRA